MKKLLLTMAASLSLLSASAQLSEGHKASNFNVTSLNGAQTVELYKWLDSGYYVYLDVSATWCGPCWQFHQSHALRDLWTTYGPGTASNDVRVIFLEGDGATTDAQMNGATGSQGNWMTGATYPMVNLSAADATTIGDQYEIGYFPTLYVICPTNKAVKELSPSAGGAWKTATQLYAERPTTCPTLITVDAKNEGVSSGTSKNISCDGNFGTRTVTIKNLGANNLTSATVSVIANGTTIASSPWTGNIAPFSTGTVSVNVTGVPATVNNVTYRVTALNDQLTTNNDIDGRLNVYNSTNVATLPYTENFETAGGFPSKFGLVDNTASRYFGYYTTGAQNTMISANGAANGKAMFVAFFDVQAAVPAGIVVVANINTSNVTSGLYMGFDYAHALYGGAEPDQLEVVYSKDCGATWTSVWSKTGTDLATTTPFGTGGFIPSAASQWRQVGVDLAGAKGNSNVLVGFRAKSGYGNYGWVDNINILTNGTAISATAPAVTFSVYPNPATSNVTVDMQNASNGVLTVTDAMGKVVYTKAVTSGTSKEEVNTTSYAAGMYTVSVRTEAGTSVQKLSIVK